MSLKDAPRDCIERPSMMLAFCCMYDLALAKDWRVAVSIVADGFAKIASSGVVTCCSDSEKSCAIKWAGVP